MDLTTSSDRVTVFKKMKVLEEGGRVLASHTKEATFALNSQGPSRPKVSRMHPQRLKDPYISLAFS